MKRQFKAFSFVVLAVILSMSTICHAEIAQLHVTRDLWLSSSSGEEEGNNGGTPRLKFKGYQEFSLVDFDWSSLKGKRIDKATLHMKLSSDERLYRVGVSTITAPWNEGSGSGYDKEKGASSFRWRANPDVPWIDDHDSLAVTDYSDITSVMFGEGGSIWNNAEATDPVDGWQSINVAPELVAACANGLSFGLVVFDDTGTEIVRNGEDTTIRLFPNRFVFSHEQNRASEPYLEVEFEDVADVQTRPSSPSGLKTDVELLPQGSFVLTWTQSNCLKEQILGFRLSLDGKDVSQTLIPSPIVGEGSLNPEETQSFKIRLNGLDDVAKHQVDVFAIDVMGRMSDASSVEFKPSNASFQNWYDIIDSRISKNQQQSSETERPKVGASEISIVHEFDKFLENEKMIPEGSDSYLCSNTVWNAKKGSIELASAKNEFVGFQIAFKGSSQKVRFEIQWVESDNKQVVPDFQFYRLARVESEKGMVVDPAIPLSTEETETVLREGVDVVLCELFVPENINSGVHAGKLNVIGENGDVLSLDLNVCVWNFALPNELNFLPEMNCYSLPENEIDYYRLAQLHRTYINRVPYSHRGGVGDGLAPEWNKSEMSFDWKRWEERFGKYFDGSAFADLPRGAIPIEAFYLPLFENFPGDIFKGFAGDFTWPDDSAFTDEYREALTAGCRAFAEKIDSEKWNQTRFLFFLNNKSDYKRNGWFNASSSWLLDEPASFRDFAALEFFGKTLKKSVEDKPELKNTILYRADISRPQWERNSLESLLDVYVVGGGSFKAYNKMVRARSEGDNKRLVYTYGTTTKPSESAYQPIFWSLDAWSLGADGIVPWQTIGNQDSWKKEDELSLFYPPTEESDGKVAASLRLKAYRSGEQLTEYLTLLVKMTGRSRDEIARAVRLRLNLDKAHSVSRSADDAGTTYYDNVGTDDLERFKRELGDYLNRMAQ